MYCYIRLRVEGFSFLVYNKNMIVYSESAIESAGADITLKIKNDKHFEYKDESNDIYSSCIVKNGKLTGKYSVSGAQHLGGRSRQISEFEASLSQTK